MAIEAVMNPKVAYQGSAPAAEVLSAAAAQTAASPVKISEGSAAGNAPESKSEENAQAQASAAKKSEEPSVSGIGTEAMRKAVEEINKNAKNSEAVFGIHDATNRVTIKIVDKDTKKVIKEYPPEKTLDMIAKVWEMAGLMVDEKR